MVREDLAVLPLNDDSFRAGAHGRGREHAGQG